MFNDSDYNFMTNNMKIIVDSIESKLNEDFFIDYKEKAIDAISCYIRIIKKLSLSEGKHDIHSHMDNEGKKLINSYHYNMVKSLKNEAVKDIFDTLRHSFSCYASGGLYDLYIYQQNEYWHPEILLTEILKPNDIDSLPEKLVLYRGCDISELDRNNFGQAWTTCINVAKHFAFTNYSDRDWFNIKNRIVLETTYAKSDILFSNQAVEYEVVINTSKLDSVKRYK